MISRFSLNTCHKLKCFRPPCFGARHPRLGTLHRTWLWTAFYLEFVAAETNQVNRFPDSRARLPAASPSLSCKIDIGGHMREDRWSFCCRCTSVHTLQCSHDEWLRPLSFQSNILTENTLPSQTLTTVPQRLKASPTSLSVSSHTSLLTTPHAPHAALSCHLRETSIFPMFSNFGVLWSRTAWLCFYFLVSGWLLIIFFVCLQATQVGGILNPAKFIMLFSSSVSSSNSIDIGDFSYRCKQYICIALGTCLYLYRHMCTSQLIA